MKFDFCVACGSQTRLQHHHIVPRSEGGGDDELNWGAGIQKVAKLMGLMPGTVSRINREMLEKMPAQPDRFRGWEKE